MFRSPPYAHILFQRKRNTRFGFEIWIHQALRGRSDTNDQICGCNEIEGHILSRTVSHVKVSFPYQVYKRKMAERPLIKILRSF